MVVKKTLAIGRANEAIRVPSGVSLMSPRLSVNFYSVGGLLVRRRTPVRHGISLQVWNGDHWVPYANVDAVLRHGRPLTEGQALALLHEARDRIGSLARLSDHEARVALRARGKSP